MRQRRVFGEHMGVIGGVLRARRSVEIAAGRLDLLGDGARAAPPRALEGHVLEKVRKAMLACALVARAGPDPDAERGGLKMRHGVGDDAQSRWQGGDARAS